ncbi:hypothetical protein NHQ30_001976 [Ciborinia camelliae]|nr:hypothetical protein NHQ30_001976 [Ciborinia camelliae]
MVSSYPDLNSPMGHDFEDDQTQAELELMDELHKLGVFKYVNLPQAESIIIEDHGDVRPGRRPKHNRLSSSGFELIKNDDQSPRYLKEGWYALRNRAPVEADKSDAETDAIEDTFFSGDEWNRLNKKRLGRHHLRSNLIKMRNRHVKQSIPGLLSEIKAKLVSCNIDISKLGPPRKKNVEQFTLVNGIETRYSRMVENSLNGNCRGLTQF